MQNLVYQEHEKKRNTWKVDEKHRLGTYNNEQKYSDRRMMLKYVGTRRKKLQYL